MNFDLTDEETASLAAVLRRLISDDRYPLSPRVKTWQAILDKVALAARASAATAAAEDVRATAGKAAPVKGRDPRTSHRRLLSPR